MPTKPLDLSGQQFGQWTVIRRIEKDERGAWRWECKCSCGTVKSVIAASLRRGASVSCGCTAKQWCTTHGMEGTRVYYAWSAMMQRCENPKNQMYKHYGDRGITVCDRWKTSFVAFMEDMGQPPENHSIDRIDNNGNYEPGNCRWVTCKENIRNRRTTKFATIDGEKRPVAEWAEINGINVRRANDRLNKGWDAKSAFTVPVRKKAC